MTTLNKIVYDIAHSMGREDDPTLLERLKFNVHALRSTIIRRDLDKNRFTPNQYIQTLCVDMDFYDSSMCEGVTTGCKVFRSVRRIPDPVRFKDRVPFYYVGTINSKKEFSPTTFSELPYLGSNKYTARKLRYYFSNGYLYLLNGNAKKVQIRGVFEYPDALIGFNGPDGKICYTDDSPYPISNDLAHDIKLALLNEQRSENPNNDKNEIKING